MNVLRNREITRRDLLAGGLAGLGIATLGQLSSTVRAAVSAKGAAPTMLVVIELRGGNDGINSIVPVTLSQYPLVRPGVAVSPSACLSMATGPNSTNKYKMHPALSNLQAIWTAGELAVVNKVGYPNPNQSHFKSLDIWELGVRGSFSQLGIPHSGWVARYADAYAPSPLDAVKMGFGRSNAMIGGTTMRFMATDLSRYEFVDDPIYRSNHQHRLNTIRKVLGRGGSNLPHGPGEAAKLAHDLVDQIETAVSSYASAVTYPNEELANSLRDVATMIQAGFGTRIFYTGVDGFDTHSEQGVLTGTHPTLLAGVDAALAAFEQDLKAMGVWNQTVVALVSEFGRRNYDNNSAGTDHGGGNCVMLCGGAVRGGIYGTDLTDNDLLGEFLPMETDFRSVYAEVLQQHLGVTDVDVVFPEPGSVSGVLGLV